MKVHKKNNDVNQVTRKQENENPGKPQEFFQLSTGAFSTGENNFQRATKEMLYQR